MDVVRSIVQRIMPHICAEIWEKYRNISFLPEPLCDDPRCVIMAPIIYPRPLIPIECYTGKAPAPKKLVLDPFCRILSTCWMLKEKFSVGQSALHQLIIPLAEAAQFLPHNNNTVLVPFGINYEAYRQQDLHHYVLNGELPEA